MLKDGEDQLPTLPAESSVESGRSIQEPKKEEGTHGLKARIADVDIKKDVPISDDEWDVEPSQEELEAQILRELMHANNLAQQTKVSLMHGVNHNESSDEGDGIPRRSNLKKQQTKVHPSNLKPNATSPQRESQ